MVRRQLHTTLGQNGALFLCEAEAMIAGNKAH